MPYGKITELPVSIKKSLPKGAQEIFKEAFNSAWKEYSDPDKRRGSESRDTTARKVAWSAVKQSYKKKEDSWVKK